MTDSKLLGKKHKQTAKQKPHMFAHGCRRWGVRVLGGEGVGGGRMVPSPAFCSVTTLLPYAPANRLHLRVSVQT